MERLGGDGENQEIVAKERLVSDFLLPTAKAVIEAAQCQSDEDGADFYATEFEHEHGDLKTVVCFETDSPDDGEEFYITIDVTHSQSDLIKELPKQEILHTMTLLKKKSHSRKAIQFGKRIESGEIDQGNVHRNTAYDVGFAIDMSVDGVEMLKTKVFRTLVEDLEVDRIAIGIGEEVTPIGIDRFDIVADEDDYKTIELACQLIQEQLNR